MNTKTISGIRNKNYPGLWLMKNRSFSGLHLLLLLGMFFIWHSGYGQGGNPAPGATWQAVGSDTVRTSRFVDVLNSLRADQLLSNGNIQAAGNISASGNAFVDSVISAWQVITADALSVGGNFSVAQNASIGQDLTVSGTSNLQALNATSITALTAQTNSITVSDTANAEVLHAGTINAGQIRADSLLLTGNAGISGNLAVTGTITADSIHIENTVSDELTTRRIISPDTVIKFGQNSITLNPNTNRIGFGPEMLSTSPIVFSPYKGLSIGNQSLIIAPGMPPKTHAQGENSIAIGFHVGTTNPAVNSIVIGSGIQDGTALAPELLNDRPNSLMIGFNSDQPTVFVSPAHDDDDHQRIGKVGIGTVEPGKLLHIWSEHDFTIDHAPVPFDPADPYEPVDPLDPIIVQPLKGSHGGIRIAEKTTGTEGTTASSFWDVETNVSPAFNKWPTRTALFFSTPNGTKVKFLDNGDINIIGRYLVNGTPIQTGKWESGSGGKIYYNDGDVGIGTNNPKEILHLNKSSSDPLYLQLTNDHTNQSVDGFKIGVGAGGSAELIQQHDSPIHFRLRGNSMSDPVTARMTIQNNGNVGIGINAPEEKLHVAGNTKIIGTLVIGQEAITSGPHQNYKLAVDGKVVAKHFKVTTNSSWWSDFVFDDDYYLMPLPELERHIKGERHLPGVPNQQDVLDNGIDLARTIAILLQKIEENTLYIINLNKENEALKKENLAYKNSYEELLKRVEKLEKRR